MATKTYDSIAYTVLGAPAASITFSSISSAYSDLRLVLSGTFATAGSTAFIQLNGDTASNYSERKLVGNGTGATSTSQQSKTNLFIGDNDVGGSTTIPGLMTADLLQYKNTGMFKTVLSTSAMDKNGTGAVNSRVGLWSSTAAINSIAIKNDGGNWNAGTTAELIGIL
jgi:hypothetical protein